MKNRVFLFVLAIFPIIFQNCQPLTSLKVETLVPAKIDFPGNFNKVVFVNLENDLNDDGETDTILFNLINKEMNMGFLDALQVSMGVDSTNFLYVKGFPDKNKLYKNDTISWEYLDRLSGKSNADIFIVLDSMKLGMESNTITDYATGVTEYYKYRELYVDAHWSVFDLFAKKRLDSYNYKDTLLWNAFGYTKADVERKITSLEQSIRETCYFTALDYAKRIFPGWKTENRYYFVIGNKDFKKAAEYASENNWDKAAELWQLYTNSIDKEISSRACFNLALASEMQGKFGLALAWAEKSNQIKSKQRTEWYINVLKKRKQDQDKLLEQLF